MSFCLQHKKYERWLLSSMDSRHGFIFDQLLSDTVNASSKTDLVPIHHHIWTSLCIDNEFLEPLPSQLKSR